MLITNYNPDVLSCLANLSNDEVFTPPNIVNDMLDMLPAELWRKPDAKFLDPVCKSGVFLREIAKRLNNGLKDRIPDTQERIDHIFKNQLYGIAITELTSLLSRRSVYCSKKANGKYSVAQFDTEEGNIIYERVQHTWENGKCTNCGAKQSVYDRTTDLETYAYNFLHTDNPEELFKMKFDVIIGNPPYQLEDGGHGRSATPIYHKFIDQAKKIEPKYISMIIPARWYSGGRGLEEFRNTMLNDDRIVKLIDFENFSDVFPGVDLAGGVCYFVWDKDYSGPCEVVNFYNGSKLSSKRNLNEFQIFIRNNKAIPIINKVRNNSKSKVFLNKIVSPSRPFGIRGYYKPQKSGIKCHFSQKIGLSYASENDITDNFNYLDKWKLLIPKSPIAGQTDFSKPVGFYYDGNVKVAGPGECCTETYLVAFASDSEKEVNNFKSYLFTKIVRFLLLQSVVSQDITREKFLFIPHLNNYDSHYTDSKLKDWWDITEDEWSFIDSKIKDI